MIYLDTSVLLAHLLSETRRPPESLWEETVVSSRLLQYETWTRIHAYGLGDTHRDLVERVLAAVAFIELERPVLARTLEPFPTPVRTLDAIHLASAMYLNHEVGRVTLASFDERMLTAAAALGMAVLPLP